MPFFKLSKKSRRKPFFIAGAVFYDVFAAVCGDLSDVSFCGDEYGVWSLVFSVFHPSSHTSPFSERPDCIFFLFPWGNEGSSLDALPHRSTGRADPSGCRDEGAAPVPWRVVAVKIRDTVARRCTAGAPWLPRIQTIRVGIGNTPALLYVSAP